MTTVTPFLWFDDDAEEAMTFYTSVFRHAKAGPVQRQGGKVIGCSWELEGQKIMALNGGPHFTFNESVSFFVNVETQDEVDYYWTRLLEGGGKPSQCGWLKDRFGLSWQIIPSALPRLLGDSNAKKSKAALDAMLKMQKIDIATLERAFNSA